MTDELLRKPNLIAHAFDMEDKEFERAMKEAVLDALRDHKKAGNPVAVWEDGKVKIIQPEDMVLPDEPK